MLNKLKLLGNLKRGLLFIVSAPAGTGKTTLIQKLVEEFPCVVRSVSCTTREPRLGEISDVHYHYLSVEDFERKIKDEEFLEYVQLYGKYYGTLRSEVEEKLNQGKHVVLVIDTQGGLQLKGNVSAIFIFIKPPSLEELRHRLIKRRTESSIAIEERLLWAQKELEESQNYDYLVVNDDLESAYQILKSIFIAEEHRVVPQNPSSKNRRNE